MGAIPCTTPTIIPVQDVIISSFIMIPLLKGLPCLLVSGQAWLSSQFGQQLAGCLLADFERDDKGSVRITGGIVVGVNFRDRMTW